MAMSLEELLAKEGFKERKTNMLRKAFSQSQAQNMPLYTYRDQRKSRTSSSLKKTDRLKSSIPGSSWSSQLPPTNKTKGGKPKAIHIRKETMDEGRSEYSTIQAERVAKYLRDAQCLIVDTPEDFVDDDKVEGTFDSSDTYKDIYSNERSSPRIKKRVLERMRSMKNTRLDDKKSMKQLEKSYKRSITLEQRHRIEDERDQRCAEVDQNSPAPVMDEAAIRAVISILCMYIKRFLSNGDFRTSFHHNCFASLNFAELEEALISECKVLTNLEQAIEVVEKAAEEKASANELKRASLQLSVIAGLNSIDGFTSGIPNSKLSACAHMYLSVVYKLQKKDRVAAKHILQVFCDSPFQARMILLPELWEHMFLPHLVHLREWYNLKADSLGDTPSKGRKLKLLEKVYNGIIDSGTSQFASYYKDWLSDSVESPSIPCIDVPSTPYQEMMLGELRSSYSSGQVVYEKGSSSDYVDMGNLSPQPMVSKKLYDTMFGRLSKPEVADMEGFKKFEKIPNSGSSLFEEKLANPFSSGAAMHTEHNDEGHDASYPGDELVDKDVQTVNQASPPVQGQVGEKFGKSPPYIVNAQGKELTLGRLARSVLTQPKTDENFNLAAAFLLLNEPYPIPYPIKMKSIAEESNINNRMPKDFVCPLTKLVFEEPVTLETGHTFEREAIREWLEQGNRTCPVTGKRLESRSVPLTNFILKRVIDSWKSENRPKIQKDEAILVIHQLLTAYSEGRIKVVGA